MVPEFCIQGYYEIPRAERENGVLSTHALAAVDVSNVMHYGVQSKQKYFLFAHSRRLGEICVDHIMRMAKSRGITCLQLHIDDPNRVPLQKTWEQRKRDRARASRSNFSTTPEVPRQVASSCTNSVPLLNMGEKVPDDWDEKVLGNRKLKAAWGNVLIASTARRCAKNLLESNNSELEVTIHGANIIFSDRILLEGIHDAEEIEEKSLPSGASLLHLSGESTETLENFVRDEQSERTKCWSLKLHVKLTAGAGSAKRKSCSFVSQKVRMDCEHGESETRMQYTLAQELESRKEKIPERKTTVIQFSKDSDSICLALFATQSYGLRNAGNVLVKMGQTYFDIRKLLNAVEAAGIDPISIGRLCCISGNDFQPFCAVANSEALIRTYCHFFRRIGDLSDCESVQTLFYYTFACRLNNRYPPELPSHLKVPQPIFPEHMTDKWKQSVRCYLFFNSKCASSLLPQDEDLILTHRRGNIFLANAYWMESSVSKKLTNLPVGLIVGTNDHGDPLLEMPSSIERRKAVIKYRTAKCRCGKSNINSLCCNPRSQCGCVKAGRLCVSKCACDSNRCSNMPGGKEAATERQVRAQEISNMEAQRRRETAPNAIHRILNTEDVEPAAITLQAELDTDEPAEESDGSSSEESIDCVRNFWSDSSESDSDIERGERISVPMDEFIHLSIPSRASAQY